MRDRLTIPNRRRRREGAAALEFAFIALPFFLLLFAILEVGVVFVLDAVLKNATDDASRLVRTGQAEKDGFTEARFKSELCARMSVFSGDCPSRVTLDVREIEQFTNPDLRDPIVDGQLEPDGLGYESGQPGSLMVVRAWYRHPVVTPMLQQSLSRLKDGSTLLSATVAFRNEPR